MRFDVVLTGFDGFIQKMQKSPDIIEKANQKMMLASTLIVEAEAKQRAPVDRGILRKSITHRVEGKGLDIIGRVGTNINYASFQEFGTSAHGPKRAKYLVFTPKGAKQPVFTKWVKGVKPQRFMQQGLEKLRTSKAIIKNIGDEILRGILK